MKKESLPPLSRRIFLGALGAGLASGVAGARSVRSGSVEPPPSRNAERSGETVAEYDVGLGQILVAGGAVEANLERAAAMIGRAADEGCRMVVLPECLDCGWTQPETSGPAETFTTRPF